ncbi:MAG TPA: universal stress protein [Steroidobacteraceae bacterium]|nr:universal stress protein [Steroidobacteraceae bacterium]
MSGQIRSILAAVDHDGNQAKRVATKAVTVARLTGAQLELFLCDADTAFSGLHQYEPQAAARARDSSLTESRRYLEMLRRGLAAEDVAISLSVACESPLYEGIVHAVRRSHPDLVIRGAAAAMPLEPNDWELVRACPAPLLLTRGLPWKARPIIAAAVDVSPGESAELTRAILRTAASFARAAGGTVELIHAGGFDVAAPPAADARRVALAERARDADLEQAECHLTGGEPAAALRELAVRRNFDLIVLGALTHRKTLTALVGTLTGRLIESLDTDFLLVKPPQA